MKARLQTIAKWVMYPAFYLFCLGLFSYVTFPYERLKDRLIGEFDKDQRAHGGNQRLEIESLTSYWWSGVKVSGVKLTLPPDDALPPVKDEKPKENVIAIDEAHVRVRMLPLLIGRVRIDFWASAFDGEVSGSVPYGGSSGSVAVEIEHVDLAKAEVLTEAIGIPLHGVATGKIDLSLPDLKVGKAEGTIDLTIEGVSVGDGKTKIKGQLALPEAKLGTLTIAGEAKDGVLKIAKFASPGPDIELAGDGKISLRDPAMDSSLDVYLKFKFSDAYRGKNDITKSLLGAPGLNAPALLDLADPKIKKAKRADGFYGFHISGSLKKVRFDPAAIPGPELPTAKVGRPSQFGTGPTFPKGGPPLGVAHGNDAPPPSPPPPAAAPPPPIPIAAPPPGPPPGMQMPPRPPAPVEAPPAVVEAPPPPPPPAPEPEPPPPEQPPNPTEVAPPPQ